MCQTEEHKLTEASFIWKNSQVAKLTWSEICACRFWISAFSDMFSLCKAWQKQERELDEDQLASEMCTDMFFPTVWCTLSSAVGHNERPTTNSCWLMNQCNVSIRRSCRWCSAYTCMLVSLVAPLLLSAFRESSRLFLCNSFSASLDRPGKSWENTQISTENYISK